MAPQGALSSTMTTEKLKSLIREAGACSVGIARLRPVSPEVMEAYQRWLAAGNHAGMTYLANNLEIRRNPALLLANGEEPAPGGSIISIAFPYFSGNPYQPGKLRFARYALGDDYHEVLRTRLRPIAERITADTGCEARICVDTAPILERYWAQQAGLGFIGRNHQLIIPNIGSYIFLAEIVTRASFTPDAPSSATCLNCSACLRACPNHGINESNETNEANGRNETNERNKANESLSASQAGAACSTTLFDARRCNSYLTIEHRGELPAGLRLPAGRLYGCDLCLEACPLAQPTKPSLLSQSLEENQPSQAAPQPPSSTTVAEAGAEAKAAPQGAPCPKAVAALPEFEPREALLSLSLEELLSLTQERYALLCRHSPIKRAKLAGLLRNARAL
jgi:epoxyqueuosine reductase